MSNPKLELLMQSVDYIVIENKFSNNKMIRIPTLKDCKENSFMNVGKISVFVDGSITTMGLGAGVYSERLNTEESGHTQGRIQHSTSGVIMKATNRPELRDVRNRDVTIDTDSQAGLNTLSLQKMRSKVEMNYGEALYPIRGVGVSLCWVPQHINVEGNQRTGGLAKPGAEKD